MHFTSEWDLNPNSSSHHRASLIVKAHGPWNLAPVLPHPAMISTMTWIPNHLLLEFARIYVTVAREDSGKRQWWKEEYCFHENTNLLGSKYASMTFICKYPLLNSHNAISTKKSLNLIIKTCFKSQISFS